ncbi:MAG: YqeG family HAD IIIA-type phosphatase [Coriobacteriia bacterium]|nr:YqeG family HAD IIIA-type phosphatase [Coriobacteriia bacterium]MBN2839591.1 YqeG family HAD IIIA-type phosphatase [Coriobacteriia bacterium]
MTALDLDALKAEGVTVLLLDVDNTVSPHHSAEVIPGIRDWIASLGPLGFRACLVSNNWHDDIHERAAALGLPVVAKAGKPLPFGIRRAIRLLAVRKSECVMVGDQIFTDVLGGKLAGVRTVLVEPLTPSDMGHTMVLRRLEQRIMANRRPEA